jgi:hypothetical protein
MEGNFLFRVQTSGFLLLKTSPRKLTLRLVRIRYLLGTAGT